MSQRLQTQGVLAEEGLKGFKMTVDFFARESEFKIICMPSPEKEIDGVYIGDLLSWVMGNANTGNMWITIMSNINIVAVATLVDTSCIILAEGVTLDDNVIATAINKRINVLSTNLSAYDAAIKIHGLIN